MIQQLQEKLSFDRVFSILLAGTIAGIVTLISSINMRKATKRLRQKLKSRSTSCPRKRPVSIS